MNIDPKRIIEYYRNPPLEKMKMIKEMRLIEQIPEENTDYIYWRFKLPMASDRDNVAKIVITDLPNEACHFLMTTVEREDHPPVPGVIRMFQQINGKYEKNPTIENAWDYTEIDHLDMKGSFPPRLLNMVIAGETAKEMKSMYNHIKN